MFWSTERVSADLRFWNLYNRTLLLSHGCSHGSMCFYNKRNCSFSVCDGRYNWI